MTDLEGVAPITKEERKEMLAADTVGSLGFRTVIRAYEARLRELEAEVEALRTTSLAHQNKTTKTFTLYWRDGKREVVTGEDIASAMTLAGYSGGAVGALDFYASGDSDQFKWRKESKEWVEMI